MKRVHNQWNEVVRVEPELYRLTDANGNNVDTQERLDLFSNPAFSGIRATAFAGLDNIIDLVNPALPPGVSFEDVP